MAVGRDRKGEALELTIDQPFRLADTLACGQGHRWLSQGDAWHEGVVGAELVRLRQTEAGMEFTGASDQAAMRAWLHRHFRLDDDVEAIHQELAQRDPVMGDLLRKHSGARVMRVDPWECLVFFILLSANNNIRRIQRDMERIARTFGEPVGGERSTFPGPGVLGRESALVGLEGLGLGLAKGRKIGWAARTVLSGRLDLESLVREPSHRLVTDRLRALHGGW